MCRYHGYSVGMFRVALCLLPSASCCAGQGEPTAATVADPRRVAPEVDREHDLATARLLAGDWGGVRSKMMESGVSGSILLGSVTQFNLRGGLNTHNANDTTGKAFYNLELDFEKMGGPHGATFFVRGIQTWNSGIGRDVGSLTPPYWNVGSSGDKEIELDKWWYRQRLLDNRLEFRLGKLLNVLDLFDRNAYAGNYLSGFVNRALNHNMTIPTTKGIGVFARAWPADWVYAQAMAVDPDTISTHNRHGTGGFDTAFHGEDRFRVFWEIGILPAELPGAGVLPGHYRFGAWLDPKPKKIFMSDLGGRLPERRRAGDVGFYANFDQMVWKENSDPADNQGLGVFARWGWADEDVNRVSRFWSIGATCEGPIPRRDADVLGFGVAQTILSRRYRQALSSLADRETVYEMFYAIKIAPWCTVTPDVQLIVNPGGAKNARDALVGGVRIKIVF